MKKVFKKIVTWILRILTRITIWRHKSQIIGIVGNLGKTETKEAIKEKLSKKFDCRANPRSYNTEIGLPLAVLYLPSGNSSFWAWFKILSRGIFIALFSKKFPKILILELGAIFPGEMDYLLTIVQPKYLICTNISLDFEASSDELEIRAKEIEKAIKAVPKNGLVIINADDPWLINIRDKASAKIVSYTKENESKDYPILISEVLNKELELRVNNNDL